MRDNVETFVGIANIVSDGAAMQAVLGLGGSVVSMAFLLTLTVMFVARS